MIIALPNPVPDLPGITHIAVARIDYRPDILPGLPSTLQVEVVPGALEDDVFVTSRAYRALRYDIDDVDSVTFESDFGRAIDTSALAGAVCSLFCQEYSVPEEETE